MLLVKTFVAPSAVHGTGLFAAQRIAQGTIIWKFSPQFDLLFTPEEVERFAPEVRESFLVYSYFNERSGHFVYCADNSKFVNHSATPNSEGVYPDGDLQGYDVALKDIEIGEEITCDYTSFDGYSDQKLRHPG